MNSFPTVLLALPLLSTFPTHAKNVAQVQFDVSLQACNTFGIAAKARAYLPLHSMADIALLKSLPAEVAALPQYVLGGGSNIVLGGDVDGLVLHMQGQGIACVGEDAQCVYVSAAGGVAWDALVQWTLQQGWGGLENLSLIPGTVGAAPIQNIGAYGLEVQDRFVAATVYDRVSGELVRLNREQCAFAYRDSIFKHSWRERGLIVEVLFALPKQWQPQLGYAELAKYCAEQGWQQPTPQQVSNAVIAIRQRKLPDPAYIGNAGSFFKNPLVESEIQTTLLQRYPQLVSYAQADSRFKLAAGWLIEQAGWKGKRLGAVGVYDKQALVLVNHGGASGAEVIALAQQIQVDVAAKFGVQLEPEPIWW